MFIKTMTTKALSSAVAVATGFFITTAPQQASADNYLGQIFIMGSNFCPRSSIEADGQLLAISQNTALFSLFGTIYGGDGRTTFGIPDLRGRAMIHEGTGAGLANRPQGSRGGAQTHTLSTQQMPSHNHTVNAANSREGYADRNAGGDDFLGVPSHNAPGNEAPDLSIYSDTANVKMDSAMLDNTGGGQAFGIESPYLALKICVTTEGIYPSRS